jgi:hypothetical protein
MLWLSPRRSCISASFARINAMAFAASANSASGIDSDVTGRLKQNDSPARYTTLQRKRSDERYGRFGPFEELSLSRGKNT